MMNAMSTASQQPDYLNGHTAEAQREYNALSKATAPHDSDINP